MFEIHLKCPVCSLEGSISNNYVFEFMGMHNGNPIIECPKCGTRIVYSMPFSRRIIGKPKIKQIITREKALTA